MSLETRVLNDFKGNNESSCFGHSKTFIVGSEMSDCLMTSHPRVVLSIIGRAISVLRPRSDAINELTTSPSRPTAPLEL